MTGTRERWSLALMLAPYLVGLTLLIVVPGVVAVSLALFEYDLIRPADFVGSQLP